MLPDLLDFNLSVVICGTAVGNKSAKTGYYYAHPSNKFWKTLYNIGLTPRLLRYPEYKELLSFGVGLTDLVKDQCGMDSELSKIRINSRDSLTAKILKYKPRMLCFNGKTAARLYLQYNNVHYGIQDLAFGKTEIFVAPSTSGAASKYWDERVWNQMIYLIK